MREYLSKELGEAEVERERETIVFRDEDIHVSYTRQSQIKKTMLASEMEKKLQKFKVVVKISGFDPVTDSIEKRFYERKVPDFVPNPEVVTPKLQKKETKEEKEMEMKTESDKDKDRSKDKGPENDRDLY